MRVSPARSPCEIERSIAAPMRYGPAAVVSAVTMVNAKVPSSCGQNIETYAHIREGGRAGVRGTLLGRRERSGRDLS